jgi:hypothetical protein
MAVSTITQTDGTVHATTWVGLLYELLLLGHILQGRHNRAKPKFKMSSYAIDYKFDADVTSLTAKVALEGQRIFNTVTNKIDFKLDSTLGDYLRDATGATVAFSGGTGALAGYDVYEEALLHTAEMVSFYEAQIEPDQLLKDINIVNTTPTPEDGSDTLDISLPLRNGFNVTTGQCVLVPKNYLYILDVSTTDAI